ncbi:phosphonatase-like hydrolase [Branchiibius sp. NY16-3462-2]|uniref:phosphonatase-like hydrolase n=1 Tax=Branchiibius sp. NY16-3462-2 TaxID=1807500 RepID=UPI0025C041A9|nr:phosphonatase-like hydrolase [Branchiibius sp. NY16-3462-2]
MTTARALELVAFDIAGTTVQEGGRVYVALEEAARALGADPTAEQIESWMGADKRAAISGLLTASGIEADSQVVEAGFADFRARLDAAYGEHPPTPMPGVLDLFDALHARGTKVALTTGFDRPVVDTVLAAVGWDDTILDAVVCVDDVAQGRPAPDMIERAMEMTGVTDATAVAAVGDTVRDIGAGRAAQVGLVVGVRSGETDGQTLFDAGADVVIDSVAELLGVLP